MKCVCLLGWVAAASTILAVDGPIFTKVTGQPMSSGAGAQGFAWGDYNGDGWIDVYCSARSSTTTTLYLNNGDGTFARAAGTIGANLVNPIGGCWGDADNDGLLDLFVSMNNGGNDLLMRNKGDGTFAATTNSPIVSSGGNGNGCAWADYNRDGFVDLYVSNSDGNNFLFRSNRSGGFTRITTGAIVSATGGSQGCAWADYDADGYPDLYVSRSPGPNLLFHNNRNGTFAKVTTGPVATVGGSMGFAWGDYNNDGAVDLFFANGGTNNYLFRNDGQGGFTRVAAPTGKEAVSLQCANWVDYDNDGWLDLFGANFAAGVTSRLYRNNGDGTFTRASAGALTTDVGRWFASAWADVDNNGFPDVIAAIVNSPNALYRNGGNGNHWLRVKCLGRGSNRVAVGAKVRVEATIGGRRFWQLREIASGGNIASQDQIDPMFGLGDAAHVETLRIEWPSGVAQEIRDVAANQVLVVKEPARFENATLRAVSGVTYEIQESTDLRNWTTLTNTTNPFTITNASDDNIRVFRALER
jgi:hypothetical protein